MKGYLKKQGLRMTLPRKTIMELLSKTEDHLSAKEIYHEVNKVIPDIGMATVYRTLEMFNRMGLLNRFDSGDGQNRYELAWSFKGHHHHMICSNCGAIIEYNDFIKEEVEFFDHIEQFLSEKHDFRIDRHEVYFFGKCSSCK